MLTIHAATVILLRDSGSGPATATGSQQLHIRRLFISFEKEEPARGTKAWATWSEVRRQHGYEGYRAVSIPELRRDGEREADDV